MMENFVNKWFPPKKPNLAAKYDKNFIPPLLQYKRSMDRLKEIDERFDLLHQYIGFRANIWATIERVGRDDEIIGPLTSFETYSTLVDFARKSYEEHSSFRENIINKIKQHAGTNKEI